MPRPEPRQAPEGYECVAVPAGPEWRLEAGKRCRRAGHQGHGRCAAESVAALNRSHWRKDGPPRWWAYCADHLYGRWVEGGQVMQWVLREVSSDGHQ